MSNEKSAHGKLSGKLLSIGNVIKPSTSHPKMLYRAITISRKVAP